MLTGLASSSYQVLDLQPPPDPAQVRVTTPPEFLIVNVSPVLGAVAVTVYSLAAPDAELIHAPLVLELVKIVFSISLSLVGERPT